MGDREGAFTVFVLGFGDHVDLMDRCLGSVVQAVDPQLVRAIVVGLNQPSPALVRAARRHLRRVGDRVRRMYVVGGTSRYKYPMMRKLFALADDHAPSPWTMWFDDDSFIRHPRMGWWHDTLEVARRHDMIGSIYRAPMRGLQWFNIRRQPWFTQAHSRDEFRFATGGWWCCRTAVLRKWGYPWDELVHNGGDTTLGELIRQQGYRLGQYRDNVAINADAQGRESKAQRRGAGFLGVWTNNDPPPPDLHAFPVDVVVL